ncbi:hypothetical protein [Chryseolinea lacunae]|uniref:Glycosyl hydrolase family 88 n=1 Tax=Chryseolinea lacunae TaxID=2801331 RepID=A0ABS1KPL6_9BACT|nr:hypothetical protein [Chryseolinea lacunae]MBL0741163.1 hypothetical protein [Chryseolinea lacunae]
METSPRSFLLFLLVAILTTGCRHPAENRITFSSLGDEQNTALQAYIASITFDSLQGIKPTVQVTREDSNTVHIELIYQLTDSIHQNDWQLKIKPAFEATRHWSPHLTPTSKNIIAQHVFRAPAMILTDSLRQLAVVPDLALLNRSPVQWYMDLDAPSGILTLGVSKSKITEHVIYERATGNVYPPGEFRFGFYLITSRDSLGHTDPWRRPLALLWKKYGEPQYAQGQPLKGDMMPYVRHTYRWAFDTWSKNVWQEFMLNEKKVGAPVFIVNVTQSPNYPGPVNEREFRSIWNQAWFSSLRSAQGLYRFARRQNDKKLLEKARMTKELALQFPQHDGLFPGVIATAMEEVEVDGKKVARSKGWNTMYFGNSDRNPVIDWGQAAQAPYHILDMSWTAWLMLTWYDELEKDPRLVAYATRYADKLMTLQDRRGFFPAWLDIHTLKPLGYLDQSPETAMSATFLLRMYTLTHEQKHLDAARRALDALTGSIVPNDKWEDFETYWSCSRVLDTLVDRKIERNNQYKKNTLSMYWTAEALFDGYKATGNRAYLTTGQRVLDELLMYQASWQPTYIPIRALGGFGVMNADGEWNDARQSLFAELILRYGEELHLPEYVHRGLAALRSSFIMMYCPENPETRAQWEKVYPFFNEKDYGFMMENYGHGGEANANGLGIGEFTIYDWGNGAASEAYLRVMDHFGATYLEQ